MHSSMQNHCFNAARPYSYLPQAPAEGTLGTMPRSLPNLPVASASICTSNTSTSAIQQIASSSIGRALNPSFQNSAFSWFRQSMIGNPHSELRTGERALINFSLSPHLGVYGVLLGLRDKGMVSSGKVSCTYCLLYT